MRARIGSGERFSLSTCRNDGLVLFIRLTRTYAYVEDNCSEIRVMPLRLQSSYHRHNSTIVIVRRYILRMNILDLGVKSVDNVEGRPVGTPPSFGGAGDCERR